MNSETTPVLNGPSKICFRLATYFLQHLYPMIFCYYVSTRKNYESLKPTSFVKLIMFGFDVNFESFRIALQNLIKIEINSCFIVFACILRYYWYYWITFLITRVILLVELLVRWNDISIDVRNNVITLWNCDFYLAKIFVSFLIWKLCTCLFLFFVQCYNFDFTKLKTRKYLLNARKYNIYEINFPIFFIYL